MVAKKINKIYIDQFITLTLIVLVVISFYVKSYSITYMSMSSLLFWVFYNYNSLNIKAIVGFFFVYYFIPLPNISTYRGTIVYITLLLYTIMLLLGLLPLLFSLKIKRKRYLKKRLVINKTFEQITSIHLLIVYLILMFVYFKYGIVLVYQELRFKIPTILSYLIKSSIYIPLFSVFINRTKRIGLFKVIKYIILPLLPAIMIGSRGTVILIILSMAILLVIIKIELGNGYFFKKSLVWDSYKNMFIG